jgi:hypothetical protein
MGYVGLWAEIEFYMITPEYCELKYKRSLRVNL